MGFLMTPLAIFLPLTFHILFFPPIICICTQNFFFNKSTIMSSEWLCFFNNLSHNLITCFICCLLMSLKIHDSSKKKTNAQRYQLSIKWTWIKKDSPRKSWMLFWKDFHMIFSNRIFSLSYFSLILFESLRIRLFSTYIITMLSMAICNKNQQIFLTPKMRSLRVFSYYVSYKESSANFFFPYYLKFSFKTLLGYGTQHFHYKSIKAAQ